MFTRRGGACSSRFRIRLFERLQQQMPSPRVILSAVELRSSAARRDLEGNTSLTSSVRLRLPPSPKGKAREEQAPPLQEFVDLRLVLFDYFDGTVCIFIANKIPLHAFGVWGTYAISPPRKKTFPKNRPLKTRDITVRAAYFLFALSLTEGAENIFLITSLSNLNSLS